MLAYTDCSTNTYYKNTSTKFNEYNKRNRYNDHASFEILADCISKGMYRILKGEYNSSRHKKVSLLGVWSSLNSIKINNIRYGDLSLRFYEPFVLNYVKEDDGYIYDNSELEMYLYGKSIEDLKEAFYEDLVVSWKLYVQCDEEELTEGAKELRKTLLKLLEEIPNGI